MAKNNSPSTCLGFLGNTARSYYFEEYNFGRPGKYLNYLFGYNDAGFTEKDKNDLSFLMGDNRDSKEDKDYNLCQKVDNNQRKNIIINTFGVKMNQQIEFEYGVDKNLVEVVYIFN